MLCTLWLLAGCSSSGATVNYTGSEHQRAVAPAELEEHAGSKALPGYRIIGVVTARCTLLGGASGIFESPCSEEAMLALARERASQAGGHALVDAECRERLIDKMVEDVDGGSVETTTRTEIVCQATVARRTRGAVVAPVKSAPPRAGNSKAGNPKAGNPKAGKLRAGEHVTIGTTRVAISFEPQAPAAKARDERDVGELAAFPEGHRRLGQVAAECESDCARSTAFRALRKKAAAVGALAIAELHCEAIGQRWRCRAVLVADR